MRRPATVLTLLVTLSMIGACAHRLAIGRALTISGAALTGILAAGYVGLLGGSCTENPAASGSHGASMQTQQTHCSQFPGPVSHDFPVPLLGVTAAMTAAGAWLWASGAQKNQPTSGPRAPSPPEPALAQEPDLAVLRYAENRLSLHTASARDEDAGAGW
jgi:hypothetical protein